MEAATKKAGGLAGITAGNTSISTVGKEGLDLTYRGYSIHDLAEHATFEEVAYLLIYGKLPNRKELAAYTKKLIKLRELPNTCPKPVSTSTSNGVATVAVMRRTSSSTSLRLVMPKSGKPYDP